MKIKYLGTAAAEGWPALFCTCESCIKAKRLGGKNIRTRSQALVDDTVLIDFPPDTYMHMLQHYIGLPNIQTLIVTHSHQDHFHGADLMFRSPYFSRNILDILHIYGNHEVEVVFEAARAYISGDMGKNIDCTYHYQEPFKPFCAEGYMITPLLAKHNPKEKCYIYMIEKEGRRMLYAHDTGFFPESTWEYIKGKHFDLVSIDCTLLEIRDGKNHMGIDDAIDLKAMLEEVSCIDDKTKYVVAHFSHNSTLLHDDIEAYVQDKNIIVAFDGLEISF